jgi:hypothetical protein
MTTVQEDRLYPGFAEILIRDLRLRRLTRTADVETAKTSAQEFLHYCVEKSRCVTNMAERRWLHDRVNYWLPVAHPGGPLPLIELQPPERYTFRNDTERRDPKRVFLLGLYSKLIPPELRA